MSEDLNVSSPRSRTRTDIDERDRFPEYGCYGRARVVCGWIPPGTSDLLDAGCAYGYGTRFFAAKARRTFGIDPNSQLIEIARRRYPAIEFVVSGVETVPFASGTFDVVVMADVLEHVRDERRTLGEIYRLLRPGGVLIVTVPHKGLFSFLDLDNVVLVLKKMTPLLYAGLYNRKEGEPQSQKPGYDDWHRHYSLADVRRLLEESDFRDNYVVVDSRRWGLLLGPIMDFVVNLTRLVLGARGSRRFGHVFEQVVSWEDNLRLGPLSYNLGLCITKKN